MELCSSSSPSSSLLRVSPEKLSFSSSISQFQLKPSTFAKPRLQILRIHVSLASETQGLPRDSPQRLLKELAQRKQSTATPSKKKLPPKRFILRPPLDDKKLAERFLNSPQLSLKSFPLLSSCLPPSNLNSSDRTWIDEYLLEAKQALGYSLEPSSTLSDENPAKHFDTLLYLAFQHPSCDRARDVVVIVEDDDKNAAKGRNRQVLRDIGNVVRRNHPKNIDPAKINHPHLIAHVNIVLALQLVKPVARRVAVAVPKPKKRAEKPKDVDVIEISSDSDEEHGLEKKAAAKKKTSVSYTSVLTARSKAACGLEKKEEIVDIDSVYAKNDLAAVEYVEDICSFYKSVEPEINEKMRLILVEWLIDVCVRFELNPETFYLTVNIMDRFLSAKPIPRKELQLVGLSALLMSSKYEEIWPPQVEDLADIADHAYSHKQILVMEKTILSTLEWYLAVPTHYVFLARFIKASVADQRVLKEEPTYPEALIGRGTAYAFQRDLENAIDDFTMAIQSNPAAGEAWKRRGQARAALGEFAEAVEDLTRALELEPKSPDILHERGIINFRSKDFTAAVKDLSICLKQEKDNKSAYTYLGLAFASLGEYTKAEEAHLKSIQLDSNYLEAWLHLAQFYQELADHSKALECIDQVLQVDNRVWKAYHLRGLVFHGLGEHRKAIQELSIGLSIESSIECLYLRGSCHHAVGEYREAVKDYDATVDVELDAVEKFVLQCLAFYQKELALYTASKVSSEFFCFDIDGDIDPMFKEYWCKRLHPKDVCEKVYRQPPLRESLKKGKLKKQDLAITKPKANLLRFTDMIGKKIQYFCPGFLPNRRQHRMAGLAVLEIAQKVSKAWRIEWRNSNKGMAKNGKKNRRRERINMLSQNRGGAGCSTSTSSETSTGYASLEDRSSGRSILSWQDVYSSAVRWRQISEPCDPVVWVNKLSEEFNSGFGSHTPMVLGQAKVIRYFPNYERTLDLTKTIIKEKLCVRSKADKVIDLSKDDKIEEIMRAETCEELHKIVGEDFWVATWCHSTAFEGKRLEGTRITCIRKPGSLGYDFAIRTPCTPARWSDFDEEMTSAWEALCNAYCGENYGSTNLQALETVRDAILRMTYYWYNFMPLARGTAVTGFVVLLGLLLAANMEFTESIPKGLQIDWEAILSVEPDSFVGSVKSWLYPSLKINTSWKDHPEVSSAFSTTGSVVAALSSYND
ncbi:hypothetical protein F2Q69_00032722 [Brassica cretica]|uniref:Cyclin-like domain-containing protein n=1 Tax=Brassica cretica TaxID=69181 RepID=A0A8S9SHN1_BRACR|nr:hypothetical protein F2Q69_00032722 [Brassica cretica]